MIAIKDIEVKYNPRSKFDLPKEFLNSIKELGLIQPVTVAKNGKGYILLDGERRLRACKKLGYTTIEAIVKDYDEQQQKEVPIITDLMKDLLPMGDKSVAISNLVNKEKKYTAESIAKTLGMSLKQVKRCIKVATLHPKIIGLINTGQIDIQDAEQIAQIGKEDIQIKVADVMSRGEGFLHSLHTIAHVLSFDDVFTYEQAKKDNKVGLCAKYYGDEYCFTFDKDYAKGKEKEVRERNEESLRKFESKHNKATAKTPKRDFKKARSNQEKLFATYRDSILHYSKGKSTKKDIAMLFDREANRLTQDSCRAILKAFGIKFKAKDMDSDKYRKAVKELFEITDEKSLARFTTFVDIARYAIANLWQPQPLKATIAKLTK